MRSILFSIPIPEFLQSLGLPQALPIFGYGVMILVAFLLCTWIACKRGQRFQVSKERVQDITTMTLFAGIIGARVLHIVLYRDHYNSFSEYFKIYNGGLVLYGSMITAPLMVMYKLKKYNISWDTFFKVFIPVVPLGIAIGRMGCFLHGCCFGVPGDHAWCVTFPADSPASLNFGHVSVHPSQLYATILGTILFFILLFIDKRYRQMSGKNLGIICMFGYGIVRLIEESFRGDTPDHVGNILNAGQGISLLLIILAPLLYLFTRSKTSD